jgi:hypothetical protein
MKIRNYALHIMLLTFVFSASAYAVDTGSRKTTLDIRLKQGFSAAYDLDNQSTTNGPANFLVEAKGSYRPSRRLTFVADFWLRGDWAPSFDSISSSGMHDPTDVAPGSLSNFNRRLPFELNTNGCTGSVINSPVDTFCSDSNSIRQFNNSDDIIRELSVKYRDNKNRFTVKVGKFQRGWGQSDGLRLLDIIHAQDLRERFAFRDSDELRIPQFMISADFNFNKLGIAKPFEAMGMKRPVLEINISPEVRHSEFVINNPNPSDRSSGGIFGLPFPNVIDPVSGAGFVGFGFDIRDNEADHWGFDDAEYSARLKFDSLGGQFTLNAFYGMQDLPTVTLEGGTFIVGNGFNNIDASVAQVPLTAADVETVVHGAPGFLGPVGVGGALPTGGYLSYLRGIAGVGPLVESPLTTLSGGGCADALQPGFGAGLACSINGIVNLDYKHRQKVIGFSFARDMNQFKFGPKQTSAAMRIETAFEFGKYYNRSVLNPGSTGNLNTPLGVATLPLNGITEFGSPALAVTADKAITKGNVLSTMIGFDYPLWVPGWDTQEKSIFTSFQFFNIHSFAADKGLLQQAPYAFDTVSEDQQFVTFLWSAPVHQQRLVFEGLFIEDFGNNGTFYRQRVDFNYFGPRWRPRLEWMHFGGNGGENAPIGILDKSDFVELSITFQF